MKRARAVLYWAGLPIGGKCKYLLAPETCFIELTDINLRVP